MTSYETILTETIGDHLLKVTLNRPEVGNAKNTQMGLDLLALWTGLIDDPGDIRCVILTGAGERIFCAGGDLKQRRDLTPKQWQHQHEIFERGRDALLECPVPVIAAINGHAHAGGLETVLVCDFAYAVPFARFALTEVTLGIMLSAAAARKLCRVSSVSGAGEGNHPDRETIYRGGRRSTGASSIAFASRTNCCRPCWKPRRRSATMRRSRSAVLQKVDP